MTEIQEATGRVKKQKQARIKFKKSKEILVQKHKGKVIQGTRRRQEHKHGAEQNESPRTEGRLRTRHREEQGTTKHNQETKGN